MKRKLFSATLAVSALILIAGLFACSDDKDDFSYLSCEEAGGVLDTFDDEFENDPQVREVGQRCATEHQSELIACYQLEDEGEIDDCTDNIIMACVMNDPIFKENPSIKKLCGDNDLVKCMTHYETTCGWDED